MKQIVLTQVKIVLTLRNLVYKGSETNSVNKSFLFKRKIKKIFFSFIIKGFVNTICLISLVN